MRVAGVDGSIELRWGILVITPNARYSRHFSLVFKISMLTTLLFHLSVGQKRNFTFELLCRAAHHDDHFSVTLGSKLLLRANLFGCRFLQLSRWHNGYLRHLCA